MVNTRSGRGYSSASGGTVLLTSSQASIVIGTGPQSLKITKNQGASGGGAGGKKQPQRKHTGGNQQMRCQHCRNGHRACDRVRPVCATCHALPRPVWCEYPNGDRAPNPAMQPLLAQNIPAPAAAFVAA